MVLASWLRNLANRSRSGFTKSSHRRAKNRQANPIERLETRTMLSAVSWDGGGGNSNWHTAANWSNDTVPGAADDVTINGGTVVIDQGNVTIASLNLNGNIAGTSNITVSGQFNWTNGELLGSGSFTASGDSVIDTPYYILLTKRTFINAGNLEWRHGHLFTREGVTINNLAGATINVWLDDDLILSGPGPRATIHNAGTFRKVGSGDTGWQDYGSGSTLDAIFENTGTVEVLAGSLSLDDLGRNAGILTTGTFTGATGTRIQLGNGLLTSTAIVQADYVSIGNIATSGAFSATTTIAAWSGFFGPIPHPGALTTFGVVDFSPTDHSTPVMLTSLTGAGVAGSADVDVAGVFLWTTGWMSGHSTVTVHGGLEMQQAGDFMNNDWILNGKTLVNLSTGHVTGHYPHSTARLFFADSGRFINAGSLSVEVDVGLVMDRFDSMPALFVNSGLFRHETAGSSRLISGIAFDNRGAVEVSAGSLNAEDLGRNVGIVTTGTFTAAAGTRLQLSNGNLSSTATVHGDDVSIGSIATSGAFSATTTIAAWSGFFGPIPHPGALTTYGVVDFSPTDHSAPVMLTSLTGAGVAGNADVDVAGTFLWTTGWMSGHSTVTVHGGLEMQQAGDFMNNDWILNGKTLVNLSTGHVTGHYPHSTARLFFADSGRFINAGSLSVEVDVGLVMDRFDSTPALFANSGLFRVISGVSVGVSFENSGTVEATAGVIQFSNGYTQTTGRTVLNGGAISGNPLQIQGGSLEGSGVVYTSIANSGHASPGLSPGLLEVRGNYSQQTGGAFDVQIGGPTAGTQYDQLHVTGAVSLAGNLNITLINGYSPHLGDIVKIIDNDDADAVTGTFAGLIEGATVAVPGGAEFRINYGGGSGNDVTLTCTREPVVIVSVDILPESFNLDSNGTLTVVIFSTATFDASQINVGSVLFAEAHAWQSTLVDANQDGRLDVQLKFRRQDTSLDAVYSQLLLDDFDADGILDSTQQMAVVSVTGQTQDQTQFRGSDGITLFLAGRSLRNLLSALFGY